VAGCALFPRDHAFHADVRNLPVAANSGVAVRSIGESTTFWPGFSSGIWEGSRGGYPVNIVDPATSTPTDFAVAAIYADRAEPLAVPLPDAPRFEGWPNRAWDRHLLLVEPDTCSTRELINVQVPGENLSAPSSWYADSVVGVNLSSNAAPDEAVTASGFSLLSGLVRFDEVEAGVIEHAIGITLPQISDQGPVWPAQTSDGRSDDPAAPRMGTWFRLRADADLSGLGPQARIVARALQVHGAVVVDTGPALYLTGEPDLRWDDPDLRTLATLSASDLEVVDPGPMRANPDPASLQIR
jgi:hypothetical protein